MLWLNYEIDLIAVPLLLVLYINTANVSGFSVDFRVVIYQYFGTAIFQLSVIFIPYQSLYEASCSYSILYFFAIFFKENTTFHWKRFSLLIRLSNCSHSQVVQQDLVIWTVLENSVIVVIKSKQSFGYVKYIILFCCL